MNEDYYVLDTDFVSSFAWINSIDLLELLYTNKMILLDVVKNEIISKVDKIPHIWRRIQPAIDAGNIVEIFLNPLDKDLIKEYSLLRGKGRLGAGEAAVMVHVKFHGGTVCSNNIRDVKRYCQENKLNFCTVPYAIYQAYDTGRIDKIEGEQMWQMLIKKRRKVHFPDFHSVIECYSSGNGIEQIQDS